MVVILLQFARQVWSSGAGLQTAISATVCSSADVELLHPWYLPRKGPGGPHLGWPLCWRAQNVAQPRVSRLPNPWSPSRPIGVTRSTSMMPSPLGMR